MGRTREPEENLQFLGAGCVGLENSRFAPSFLVWGKSRQVRKRIVEPVNAGIGTGLCAAGHTILFSDQGPIDALIAPFATLGEWALAALETGQVRLRNTHTGDALHGKNRGNPKTLHTRMGSHQETTVF